MRTTRTISVSVPPNQLREMERTAKRENRTMSEILREAFRRYVQPPVQPATLAEALQLVRDDARQKGASRLTQNESIRKECVASSTWRRSQDDHVCGDLRESPSWHHPFLVPSATQTQATVKHAKHATTGARPSERTAPRRWIPSRSRLSMRPAMRAPLARANTKLHSAEKMAASVRGLIRASRRSLGRRANHAPTTVGTVQISNPRSEARPAPTIPRILTTLPFHHGYTRE
jgi:Arc/MetJ-type ribon-helix-helix transcriptional regulator